MAVPIPFEGQNSRLTSTTPGIRPLPVLRLHADYGHCTQLVSCWQLDAAELAQLAVNGGRVWLTVMSCTTPPLRIGTERPFVFTVPEDALPRHRTKRKRT